MTTGPLSVRPARADDPAEIDRVYDICLRTGAAGKDATDLFDDPRLLGDVFAGPYLAHSPDLAWVLAPEGSSSLPVGYFLAVADTASFERELEDAWWPRVRARTAQRTVRSSPFEGWLHSYVDSPPRTSADLTSRYPAHFHVDLLPEAQGGGHGRRLLSTALNALRERGVPGVHLGVSAANTNALAFYAHLGFELLDDGPDTKFLTMRL
ncbi:GNAT family N-acetyltransferase [Actinomadura algeriensis]|uniref:GNAT superfamily N-acetyltransferase n=1 Tax=Actinomadura algeriensis TaxID=1679523 RepID=A0ABR9JSP9_9ACTN|nr:GNAT family N-acetyltransferase [Actinomadura algeriensis]MBE1533587.1 GNAT superfamily N-acetyltransferase [Actinomadura algeriensis]